MPWKPIVVCDFDGTITQADVTDLVLAQFAHPSWREVEQEWMRGLIGSRECLERQMAMVETSAAELNALIDSVPVDPHFVGFYRSLRRQAVPFYVMTDGFDYVVRRVLRRAGLAARFRNGSNVFASELRIEGRSLRTAFPFALPSCRHGCATCKAALIRQLRQDCPQVVFIGDGLSDRFAVEEADAVFARPALLAYCRQKGIHTHPFETFADIGPALGKLTGRRAARRRPEAVPAAP